MIPAKLAKMNAPFLLMRPRTRGRFLVRLICASYLGSRSMLNELADAQHNAVPLVRKTIVRAESEGEIVVVGSRRAGTG